MLLQRAQVPATPPPSVPVPPADQSFGDTMVASFQGAFTMILTAIPRILGFIVVVAIGWFLSSLIARAVIALLRAARFEELMQKSGIGGFMSKMGTGLDTASIVAAIVKWMIRIVVLLVAFDVLGLPAASDVMRQLLLWLPNVVVAMVVLFVGGIAARALGNVVRAATAEGGFADPDTLSNVAQTAVWVFAIVVAVNQLGIATNLINALFTGVIGAAALAAGLAFGLGGRDLAARTLESWYDQAKPKASRAAQAARDQNRGA